MIDWARNFWREMVDELRHPLPREIEVEDEIDRISIEIEVVLKRDENETSGTKETTVLGKKPEEEEGDPEEQKDAG